MNPRITPKPPHLRISRHGPIRWLPNLYSVSLVKAGVRTHLAYCGSRCAAQAAAARLCRKLCVTIRGRWSSFYPKLKRREFERRQQLVAQRAAQTRDKT